MGIMDKIEKLVAESEHPVAVLGNLESTAFELVPVDTLSESASRTLYSRGLGFLGVIGLVNGQFRTALEVELSPSTSQAIVHAFVQHMTARLSVPKRDNGDWLERLHSLPDPRTEN
jgi:hypothetical protein